MNVSATQIAPVSGLIVKEHWFRIGTPGTSFFLFSWFHIFTIASALIAEDLSDKPLELTLDGIVDFLLSGRSATILH